MPSNADSLVRDAISAYRAGQKDQARTLLLQAVDQDEKHEQAWLWLSAVVDTVEDQMTCLENVLTINPNNEKAKQGLSILSSKSGSDPAATAAQPDSSQAELEDEDPFASVSFTSPVKPPPPAFESSDTDDELPNQVEWDTIATSSPSARRPANEPSSEDYGDWIQGLNIGSNDAAEIFGPVDATDSPVFNASPFLADDDVLLDEDAPFELDRSIFEIEDELAADSEGDGPFTANPFSAGIDEADEVPAKPTPTPAPAPTSKLSVATAAPRRSPEVSDDDLLAELDSDEDDFFEDDFNDTDFGVDPAEFFTFIPAEIKGTRMPGTKEGYPALIVIGLLLLLVLNGGALALVYTTLTGSG